MDYVIINNVIVYINKKYETELNYIHLYECSIPNVYEYILCFNKHVCYKHILLQKYKHIDVFEHLKHYFKLTLYEFGFIKDDILFEELGNIKDYNENDENCYYMLRLYKDRFVLSDNMLMNIIERIEQYYIDFIDINDIMLKDLVSYQLYNMNFLSQSISHFTKKNPNVDIDYTIQLCLSYL